MEERYEIMKEEEIRSRDRSKRGELKM